MFVHSLDRIFAFDARLTLMNIELEHPTKVGQLYHRYAYDHYYLYSVGYSVSPMQVLR